MSDVEALVARADALTDLGRNADAVQLLRRALAEAPDHDRALALLAYACYHERRFEEALAAAAAASAANPALEMPHRIAALSLLATGRWAGAEAAARTAMSLAPHAWLTHVAYAQVLTAGGHRVGALRAAVRAVELGPDEADAHLAHADVAAEMGLTAEAERSYRRALDLRPQDAVARHDLAVLQMRSHRYTEAVAGFAGAASADPGLRLARDNLVTVAWRVVASAGLVLVAVLVVADAAAAARGLLGSVPSRVVAAGGALGYAAGGVLVAARTPATLHPFLRSLRRTRPVLVLAAAATLLVALCLAGFAAWPERIVLRVAWAAIGGAAVLIVLDRVGRYGADAASRG